MARELPWPDQDYGEDHAQFNSVLRHPELGPLTVEADDLLYVHRRHDKNASVAHRKNLWQGVMPLQLAGPEASSNAALVSKLLQEAHSVYLEDAHTTGPNDSTTSFQSLQEHD